MRRVRRTILLIMLFAFPMIYVNLSPYVIIDGAAQGIVNASMILFAALTIIAMFFGRIWCGWICPGSGMAEVCEHANPKPSPNGKYLWIKWVIWVLWMGLIVVLALRSGGFKEVDLLFHNETGIPLEEGLDFIIYYGVLTVLFILPALLGKRAMCKYICWMAPFQIIGKKIGGLLRFPSLALKTNPKVCNHCRRCNKSCPMSIEVEKLIQNLDDPECILCGNCIESCSKKVISFKLGWKKNKEE